jgi:hypothetical protein
MSRVAMVVEYQRKKLKCRSKCTKINVEQ